MKICVLSDGNVKGDDLIGIHVGKGRPRVQ